MKNSHHLYLEDSISLSYIFKPIDWKTSSSFSCSQCCFLPHLLMHFSHFMVANIFSSKYFKMNFPSSVPSTPSHFIQPPTSAAFSSLSLLLQFLILSRSVKAGTWKIFILVFPLGKEMGEDLVPFQNLMNCCWSEDDTFGTRRRGSPLNLLFLKLWIRWLNFSIRNWVGKKCKILLFFLQEFGDHIFWKQLLLTWSSAERFRFSFIRNRIFSTWVVDNF